MHPITSLKSDNQKAVPNFVALTVIQDPCQGQMADWLKMESSPHKKKYPMSERAIMPF